MLSISELIWYGVDEGSEDRWSGCEVEVTDEPVSISENRE
jgi:hypothetical protein